MRWLAVLIMLTVGGAYAATITGGSISGGSVNAPVAQGEGDLQVDMFTWPNTDQFDPWTNSIGGAGDTEDEVAAQAQREREDRERDLAVAEDARCRAYRRAWGWPEVWQTVLAKGHELTRPA
jgi:hypothetical protein